MTDRFKFRAWDGKKMYYDFELQTLTINEEVIIRECKVEQWKIMQCTGLKDVEGKLIFESDIVQYERGLPDPVTGLLEVVTCTIEWRNGGFYIPTFHFNLKIIGNIYEAVQE